MKIPEVQESLGSVKESVSAARFALRGTRDNIDSALGSLYAAERALKTAIDRLEMRRRGMAYVKDGTPS